VRLYDSAVSANCYKVRLLAAHLGLELERVPVDIFAGEAQTEDHLARNPAGRTPVLELDSDTGWGEHLPESGAILLYLAEGTPLLPDDRFERARVTAWLFFEQNLLEPNIGTGRFWLLTGRVEGHEALLERWRDMGEKAVAVLERQLATTPFLAGETYTIADVALYAYTHVAPELGLDFAAFPSVGAWLERVEAQPGFMNDLEPYPRHAGAGGRSAHG
jgi:glutathione S-transferase